ncbi:GOLPH3/VPS74 family protein [Phaeacidiphilus oryzae]|uniref:GOLPH3/VPS74 family protein n=1 Tax=Phaeacidiphilus oryzae TaxID=348818 RepID=UPI00056D56A1|nr:GPP34 family phosphoprotein [Phaeacidiphilus oryzae]
MDGATTPETGFDSRAAYRLPLPEELLLLCLDPRSLRVRQPQFFRYALAGAVLAELQLNRSVRVGGGRVGLASPAPRGEPGLDAALAWVAEAAAENPRGLPLQAALRRLARNADRPYLDALVSRGLLRVEQRRVLGLFPRTGYYAESADAHRRLAAEVDAAVRAVGGARGGGGVPPGAPAVQGASVHDRRLAALAAAGCLSARLYPGWDGREPRIWLQLLVARDEIADAVRRLVETDQTTSTAAAASSR